jgi:hypothetical protein
MMLHLQFGRRVAKAFELRRELWIRNIAEFAGAGPSSRAYQDQTILVIMLIDINCFLRYWCFGYSGVSLTRNTAQLLRIRNHIRLCMLYFAWPGRAGASCVVGAAVLVPGRVESGVAVGRVTSVLRILW